MSKIDRIDKRALRDKLLSMEETSAEEARKLYDEFVGTARLDPSVPTDSGDRGVAENAAALAASLEGQLHTHEERKQFLESLRVEPMTYVETGALVTVNRRHLFLAVPSPLFEFQGLKILGISHDAPLAKEMAGLTAGDTFEFHKRKFEITAVY
ncbi:MAG TPA: hypothetical protein VE621_04210 [Bryobacteraceae bacterium]|jgi:hypothetical protein|nr:hypothetical protein [Bryobacteraceae bacterium]